MDRIRHIFSLVLVAVLLLTIAVRRDGRLLGVSTDELLGARSAQTSTVQVLPDGTRVFSSEVLAKDVIGYAGPTPVRVFLKDGRVVKVEAMKNNETPSFNRKVVNTGLLESWNGLSIGDALEHRVDAVSGATYTSVSFITNVKKTLEHASTVCPMVQRAKFGWDAKMLVALLLVAGGVVVSVFFKTRVVRTILLVLNVLVLGVWCGSFLSMSLLVGWLSNGVNITIALVPLALLVVAVVMPFFGKKSYYCMWVCPMGAAQELLGKLQRNKLRLAPRVAKVLSYSRMSILAILVITMWLGVGFELMDYEVFSVFIFKQASWVVIVMAAAFLLLSVFMPRPYCRYICPTGQLLDWSEGIKLIKLGRKTGQGAGTKCTPK